MWGQGAYRDIDDLAARIIPTRVGTSNARRLGVSVKRDHPHACGDKSFSSFQQQKSTGSSPRVWGQDCTAYIYSGERRIIPTRVGTRMIHDTGAYLKKDHPHACGDKKFNKNDPSNFKGSSPRVWGQATTNGAAEITSGIIPTRVGTRTVNSPFGGFG